MMIAWLQEYAQHGQAVRCGSCLVKRLVLCGIPVHQMQFTGIRDTVDRVFRSLGICAAPMAMELLELEDLITQWTASQFRVGAVYINSPAIACDGIDSIISLSLIYRYRRLVLIVMYKYILLCHVTYRD